MNSRLNIQELANLLAERCHREPDETERFLRLLIELITEGVFQDQLVKVKGLGTFKLIVVEPRESVNVNTGERILIKAHYKFSFMPDKELREEVNKPFSAFEATEVVRLDAFKDMIEEETLPASETIDTEETEASVDEFLPDEVVLPSVKPTSEIPTEESAQTKSDGATQPVVEAPQTTHVEPKASEESEPVEKQEHIELRRPVGPPVVAPAKYTVWHFVVMGLILLVVTIGAYHIGRTHAFRLQQVPGRPTLAEIAEQDSLFELDSDSVEFAVEAMPVDTLPKAPAPLANVTIQKGDRLTSYAYHYYGHKLFWVYIYQHNKRLISDPNNVPIGTAIEIPAPELYGIDAKDRRSLEVAAVLQTKILTNQK